MRKHKDFKGSKHQAGSLDGIISDGRRLGVTRNHSYRPNQSSPAASLDAAINRPDGFHPLRQGAYGLGQSPEAAETEALLEEEPIVLDDEGYDKPRPKSARAPKWRAVLKRTALGLGAILLIGAVYFGVKLYITQRHLFHGGGKALALIDNIDPNQLKGEGDGRVNILLLGIGGPGHEGADLTDTVLLVSIDPVNNKLALLSIPRDLWVKIPGDGAQKLNAAYTYGKQGSKAKNETAKDQDGLNLLDKSLEPVLGIPIHYHAVVDFAAFKQAVDAVGGLSFYVPEELYDPTIAWENHYNSVIAAKGNQTFNGEKALLYVKSRETSSDFARSQRQRQVLVALKDKILSAGTFSNPIRISSLLDSFGNNVYTDFSSSEISRVYKVISKVPSNDITSLDLVTPPHNLLTTGNLSGLSIVEPRAGLFSYSDLQNYVRNALRDGFIAKENASLAVYNATTQAGLATTKANELKSYGYKVTTVANAPLQTNPGYTILVDLSKGKDRYTRHYLEQRLGVTATGSVPSNSNIQPPSGTSFVIILGKDAATSAL